MPLNFLTVPKLRITLLPMTEYNPLWNPLINVSIPTVLITVAVDAVFAHVDRVVSHIVPLLHAPTIRIPSVAMTMEIHLLGHIRCRSPFFKAWCRRDAVQNTKKETWKSMLAKSLELSQDEAEYSLLPSPNDLGVWGWLRSQACLTAETWASQASDISPLADLNEVLDKGLPKPVIGLSKAAELDTALNIPLHFRALDSAPFVHGYGPDCTNSIVVFAIWTLPFQDISGNHLHISFYVTVGSNHPLIDLDVISQGQLNLAHGTLTLPGPVRLHRF